MGLYINENQQGIFKHVGKICEPNQSYFRRDYLQELLQEQHQMHQMLNKKIMRLTQSYEKQAHNQSHQFLKLTNRLDQVTQAVEVHDLTDQQLQKQVLDMAENNQKVLERIEAYNTDMKQIEEKIDEQIAQQAEMTYEINENQKKQKDIVDRMENQEALTEKLLRQVGEFRALLYERTHYLAEQFENGYHLMATQIYKQLTGVEQPLTLLTNDTDKKKKVT